MSAKRERPFYGICTALITPFRDGEIDYRALDELLEAQIEGGVSALCILGTTGEAVTLSDGERFRLIAHAIGRIRGRVKTVVGVGTPSTARSVEYAAYAWGQGADALLVSPPYYNKGTHAGLVAHFHKIADATDLPLILYNVPSRTGVDLTLPLIKEIAVHPRIVGIKEAADSVEKLASLSSELGDTLALYAGNDCALLPTLALGGEGCISVLSNLLPAEWSEVYRLWQAGRVEEAREGCMRLLPLVSLLFQETNPAPIKCAMALAGYIQEELRLPLAPVEGSLRECIRQRLGL